MLPESEYLTEQPPNSSGQASAATITAILDLKYLDLIFIDSQLFDFTVKRSLGNKQVFGRFAPFGRHGGEAP